MSRETDEEPFIPRTWWHWLELMGFENFGTRMPTWAALGTRSNPAGTLWWKLETLATGWACRSPRQVQRDVDTLIEDGVLFRYSRSNPGGGRVTFYVIYPDLMDEERLRTILDPVRKPNLCHPDVFKEADFAYLIDRFAPDEFLGKDRAIFRRDIGGRIARRHEESRRDTTSGVTGTAKRTAKGSSSGTPSGSPFGTPSPSSFKEKVAAGRGTRKTTKRTKDDRKKAPLPQIPPAGNSDRNPSGSHGAVTTDTPSGVASEDPTKPEPTDAQVQAVIDGFARDGVRGVTPEQARKAIASGRPFGREAVAV